jgi:hypothetical protein
MPVFQEESHKDAKKCCRLVTILNAEATGNEGEGVHLKLN